MNFTPMLSSPVNMPLGHSADPLLIPLTNIPQTQNLDDIHRIIVHHVGVNNFNLPSRIPYHFCVRPNGEVIRGVPLHQRSPHAARSEATPPGGWAAWMEEEFCLHFNKILM